MLEPTPSQLKIDGIANIPMWDGNFFVQDFEAFIQEKWQGKWAGIISLLNPEAESFMVSIPKIELDGLKDQISTWKKIGKEYAEKEAKNNEAYSDLAERYKNQDVVYHSLLRYAEQWEKDSHELQELKASLVKNKRLELKDSPIKAGLKRIWKWFKSTVGQ